MLSLGDADADEDELLDDEGSREDELPEDGARPPLGAATEADPSAGRATGERLTAARSKGGGGFALPSSGPGFTHLLRTPRNRRAARRRQVWAKQPGTPEQDCVARSNLPALKAKHAGSEQLLHKIRRNGNNPLKPGGCRSAQPWAPAHGSPPVQPGTRPCARGHLENPTPVHFCSTVSTCSPLAAESAASNLFGGVVMTHLQITGYGDPQNSPIGAL